MVGYLPHCTFNLNGRAASIDTPLHSLLPFAHVDHVHPDAIIALAASSGGEAATREIWGGTDRLAAVEAARLHAGRPAARLRCGQPGLEGVMLAGHGIICWADSAKACYEHTIDLIADAAELPEFQARRATGVRRRACRLPLRERAAIAADLMPRLRGLMTGARRKVGHFSDDAETLEFVGSAEFERLAAVGTSCPDHFLRTKIAPLTLDPARLAGRRLSGREARSLPRDVCRLLRALQTAEHRRRCAIPIRWSCWCRASAGSPSPPTRPPRASPANSTATPST